MAAQGVTIEALRALMRRRGVELCEQCVERYAPCAALMLQHDIGRTAHIAPVVYYCDDWGGSKLPRRSYAGRLCDGQRPEAWEWRFVAIPKDLAKGDFAVSPREGYPRFRSYAGRPLDGLLPEVWGGGFVAVHKAFADGDFVVFLLERYPCFTNQPITVELQERVGCDLEAELAMWQLSK
jgi:hypothetical protein